MNVLHITTRDQGGAGLCCIRIHQSLLDSGINSKVLTMVKTSNAPEVYGYGYFKIGLWRLLSKILRLFKIKLTELNEVIYMCLKYHNTYSLPVSPVDLSTHELIDWADIIHLHWVNNYVDIPSFIKKVNKPIVWTLHDENLFCGIAHYSNQIIPNNKLEEKYSNMKLNVVGSAPNINIVFLSRYMQQQFGDHPIVKNKRQTVINNFVDSNVFKPVDKEQARKRYNIPSNKTVVVFLAYRIEDPRKGLHVLIDSLTEIPVRDWLILAIGKNDNMEHHDMVKTVGLINSQEELSILYSCGDFFAMPSLQEGFAQAPMEAMACGLPVVAFPCSGTEELINDENGVICQDFTKNSLKNGITVLLNKKYDAGKIREYVANYFSKEVIAQKYISFYNSSIQFIQLSTK